MTDPDNAMKAAVKEALTEWLDQKWTQGTSKIGKWLLGVVCAGVLAALVYLILWANGWRLPQ